MIRRSFIQLALVAAVMAPAVAVPPDLYTSTVIVTGTGEENRLLGFRECVPRMLVRVSGDSRLLDNAGMGAIVEEAERHVASFAYRDRLEGVPIHDEQGTYARPHDLTCRFDPVHADDLLAQLGSRPWPLPRPAIEVFAHVTQGDRTFVLAGDGSESPYMAESLALAAEPLALEVVLPEAASRPVLGPELPLPDTFDDLSLRADGRVPLAMTLEWSDADLGWIANYRIVNEKGAHDWSATGISFDEAFRVGLRGAAQILSGNGSP